MKRKLTLFRFLPFYLVEMCKSNIRVAIDVLSPRPNFHPDFVSIDLSGYSPQAQWAAACLISMTPGTLAIDIDDKTNQLLVHTLYGKNPEHVQRDLQSLISRALGEPHLLT